MAKKKAVKKIIRKKLQEPDKGINELRVSDLEITDEFRTIGKTKNGKAAAEMLMKIPHGIVLVINDNNRPEGVITAREFLTKIMSGENPVNINVASLMNTDIMEVKYNALLDKVVPKVTEQDPYAVIVTDKNGEFKGYFSPKDYQEALARINYPV